MAISYDGSDVVKDTAEGTIKGILSWSKDEISKLVAKLKNRDLAFIGDIDTINLIKEQLKTGEWDISNKYVDDPILRILIQMGLTLRRLEETKERVKLLSLRDKIHSRFGQRGVHIAQFIQRKIFSAYLGVIISKVKSVEELKSIISDILWNIEKYVIFIKEKDNSEDIFEQIKIRIFAHKPATFIIFSKYSANPIAINVIKILRNKITNYSIEQHNSEVGDRIYFLSRLDNDIDN